VSQSCLLSGNSWETDAIILYQLIGGACGEKTQTAILRSNFLSRRFTSLEVLALREQVTAVGIPKKIKEKGSKGGDRTYTCHRQEAKKQFRMKSQIRETLPTFSLHAVAVALLASACPLANWAATANDQSLSCAQMEEFLRMGKIRQQKGIPKGVTLPTRATLEYNGVQHDAAVQTVNIAKASYQTTKGTELNFKDYWGYNVAGYELAKILELNMVPPYVERKVGGNEAALSWWVNDSMMEIDRENRKLRPPDLDSWNKQMYAVRVWHQLIFDTDPNLTNILITKDWQIWIIDFTRAFRLNKNLRDPKDLVQCDRRLLAKLRTLDKDVLKDKLSRWLTKSEIEALAARAAKIVDFFDKETAAKGEGAVLYDIPRTQQACGTGL